MTRDTQLIGIDAGFCLFLILVYLVLPPGGISGGIVALQHSHTCTSYLILYESATECYMREYLL